MNGLIRDDLAGAETGLRLERLKIRNYKGLDELEIQLPAPLVLGDPDLFALGSENGLGKTSILESCVLLFLAAAVGEGLNEFQRYVETPLDVFDLLIRSGHEKAEIEGSFAFRNQTHEVRVALTRKHTFEVKPKNPALGSVLSDTFGRNLRPDSVAIILQSLTGITSEPVLFGPLMYFHSYRKVMEGNPDLGMMVDTDLRARRNRYSSRSDYPVSLFKIEILRSMMGTHNLFENIDENRASDALEELNDLLAEFVGGRVEKLRPSPDNTLDFRIKSEGSGSSFSFDGLSSGQKEIISTLFLIWKYTNSRPGIVLIDEPEMHLNAQWHKLLIRKLQAFQPKNQYIIATHSEDVFDAVEQSHRMLLRKS